MNWKICTDRDGKELLNFLLDNEMNAVALINRFYNQKGWQKIPDPGKGTFYVSPKGAAVRAACFFGNNGLVLPVFSYVPANDEVRELLVSAAGMRLKIQTVMGIKKYTQPFLNIIASGRSRYIDYYYMISGSGGKKYRKYLKEAESSPEIEIEKAKTANCSEIYPLHRAYEIEEVLIDKNRYNAAFSYMTLKKILKNEQVYLLRYNKKIAAKCNSNAHSPNYVQVGGMFTVTELRNRGFGTMVLSGMMEEAENDGKQICLFVKKNNQPAVALYRKLGFEIKDEYAILYL